MEKNNSDYSRNLVNDICQMNATRVFFLA